MTLQDGAKLYYKGFKKSDIKNKSKTLDSTTKIFIELLDRYYRNEAKNQISLTEGRTNTKF